MTKDILKKISDLVQKIDILETTINESKITNINLNSEDPIDMGTVEYLKEDIEIIQQKNDIEKDIADLAFLKENVYLLLDRFEALREYYINTFMAKDSEIEEFYKSLEENGLSLDDEENIDTSDIDIKNVKKYQNRQTYAPPSIDKQVDM